MTEKEKLNLEIQQQISNIYEINNYDICVDLGTVITIKNSFFNIKLKCVEGSCKKCFFYENFGKVCDLLNCSGKCFEKIEVEQLKTIS